MNEEEIARCQRAIAQARSGEKYPAYREFCALYTGNEGDTTLLSWIAFTTPSVEEADRAIADLARLDPEHPGLEFLRNYVSKKRMNVGQVALSPDWLLPVMSCPYCHHTGKVRIVKKISTGGWIVFVVVLFLFFPLCWIGLLIKTDYYACNRCGIVLGPIAY